MRTPLTVALLLALGGAAPGAAAQSSDGDDGARKVPYVVRYLVFQHNDFWDDPLPVSGPVNPEPKGARPEDLNASDGPAEDPLDPLWQRLAESDRYRPLIRGTAVPFAGPREDAEPIAVAGRWPASVRPDFAALAGPADRPLRLMLGGGWAVPETDGTDRNSDRIRGSLTFYKGRYAHLAVNLVFSEPRRWMPWGVDRQHHLLVQSRRLLPDRYYYFDHPRFGVIARIEPMD